MDFLRFLESIRLPFFNQFFSLCTYLGDEIAFLVVAMVMLWCVDKKQGFYILFSCFFGTMLNQAMKLAVRIERPWVRDPSFTIVESARATATGYSFPSGHTQNAIGNYGVFAIFSKKRHTRALWMLLIAVVAFSRMYLGVHTPLDVGFALVSGALILLVLYPVFKSDVAFQKYAPWLFLCAYITTVLFVLYAFLFPDGLLGEAGENLLSARKNACSLHGAVIGMIPAYYLDRKYLHYETKAKYYAQVLKVVLGLCGALLIKTFLTEPLNFLCGNEYVGRVVRYFLVVAFAGLIWPLTFSWFSKLSIPKLDAFGEKVRSLLKNSKGTTV